ncbi:MAG: DUF4250 domain-containing protein [Acutalibacteraceae bacterium]
MNIPNDPIMLLSYINTQLRDYYSSLEALCEDKNLNISEITEKLNSVNYEYDKELNKFI